MWIDLKVGRCHFYIRPVKSPTMSDHHHEGHFPEEAEQNEIGGPVLVAVGLLGSIVLLIWAMS